MICDFIFLSYTQIMMTMWRTCMGCLSKHLLRLRLTIKVPFNNLTHYETQHTGSFACFSSLTTDFIFYILPLLFFYFYNERDKEGTFFSAYMGFQLSFHFSKLPVIILKFTFTAQYSAIISYIRMLTWFLK